MLTPQFQLPLHRELVVDLFAGGGGASTGIEQAIGRPVDIAINHDPEAISLHAANHPQTIHHTADIFEVDPMEATRGQPVGLLWASPSCTHFSRARGGVPVSKQLRSLGWVVVRWAAAVRPRVIICENVVEWRDWGPLRKGRPCQRRKGRTFRQWVGHLRNLGYRVEIRELVAADYDTPTIRRRLFVVAVRDGGEVVWPKPSHSRYGTDGLPRWRAAAECIDWSLPVPSIFGRKRPLADATLRRIAKGVMRYVVDAAEPFIVPLRGTSSSHTSSHSLHDPLSTVSAGGTHHGLIVPTLIQQGYGERKGQSPRVPGLENPLGTIVSGGGKHALVAAFLAKHYTGVVGASLKDPMPTVTSVDHNALVAATLIQTGHGEGTCGTKRFSHGIKEIREPLNTITASGSNGAMVAALLCKYYGNERDGIDITEPMHTIPTKDRFGLVTVHLEGEPYIIADIGMRMLQPHELYLAQGFPPNYCISHGADGKPLTKTAQVRMVGNSVCPSVARALVAANYHEMMPLPVLEEAYA